LNLYIGIRVIFFVKISFSNVYDQRWGVLVTSLLFLLFYHNNLKITLQFFIMIKITARLEQLLMKSNSLSLRVIRIERSNNDVTSKSNVTSNFPSLSTTNILLGNRTVLALKVGIEESKFLAKDRLRTFKSLIVSLSEFVAIINITGDL